jgi:arylsulfatase
MLATVAMAQDKPNILVIWGDDIGWFNVSAYNNGMMGYRTPNIDRIANEGILFTDSYGENSCTAGRAAFITGQSPFRTGLLKVGLPGAKEGLSEKDPTLAGLLKDEGYMTAQYGKNHLGDLDEHLPTNHGFDEFFGNLYHLNAEEEPENEDYPQDPAFKERFGPRGVISSSADGRIEDTGPLTRKRMETIDREVLDRSLNFLDRANASGKPFFLWFNTTRMHIWTHLKEESQGVTGQGIYADGMAEHDTMVGELLDKLEELGVADNTIVMYSTDNGAEAMTWPDGGTTVFKGEKNTTWEGGFRVPTAVRWPGRIKPNQTSNEIISHQDWIPTLMAAAGNEDVKEDLKKGRRVNGKRPSTGVFLLHRRRFGFGPPLQRLEDTVHRATRPWCRCLVGTLCDAASSHVHQSADGSVRTRGARVDTVSKVGIRTTVRARPRAGHRRRISGNVQRLPAPTEARQLLTRPGFGRAAGRPAEIG